LWSDETIQEGLEGCKKNSQVYAKLRTKCTRRDARGHFFSAVIKLKGNCRKIKDGYKQTGNNRMKNKFYNKMNEVMSVKHSVTPPLILDTSVSRSVGTLSLVRMM